MELVAMIKGITVNLIMQEKTGVDDFGAPIYKTTKKEIENVLVAPSTSDDVVNSTNLYGKKAIYNIAIPKSDTNEWEDQYVEFFGKTWHVFGFTTIGIDDLIPLTWNKKAMVERYG